MNFEEHIIQVALLGTDKQQINNDETDDVLLSSLQTISNNTMLDSEEVFLQSVSLAFNYRQAGINVQANNEAVILPALAEEKEYCSAAAVQTLRDIINIESSSLFELWLQGCVDNNLLVPPEFIPQLLNSVAGNKKLLPLIIKCCGKRGEWLAAFNEAWKFSASDDLEELWQTGSLEQRQQVLEHFRQQDAPKALQMLRDTWGAEDANTKTVLLAVLEKNIGGDDLEFLQDARAEKSKKVKELATTLLKLVPSSEIIKQYVQIVQRSIQIKKERTFLGLVSKRSLQIQLPQIEDTVFASGIDKLSNIKELDDASYILYQLIMNIPPAVVKETLQADFEEIADVFLQRSPYFLTAFIKSAINFKDVECLRSILYKDKNNFYPDAFALLTEAQANAYGITSFEQQYGTATASVRNDIIDMMSKNNIAFSAAFCSIMCPHLAANSYQFNRRFYGRYIHLFHKDLGAIAQKHVPQAEYYIDQWNDIKDVITQLMHIRSAIGKHFIDQQNN